MAVLLLWFYLTGVILLVGAELNAVVDDQIDPQTMAERRLRVNEQAGAPHGQPAPAARAPARRTLPAAEPVFPRLNGRAVVGAFVTGLLLGRLVGRGRRTAGRSH